MPDKNLNKPKKSYSADWLVGGLLTKIGETFDRLTGRNWKPASSLSTSELIERLKNLLDSELKDLGAKGRVVPHNIKLKMQWNKFSTDSEDGLRKLEYEMLTAAIDHINDKRYHTYQPLKIEIKPDYFTEGIKFLASFGEFAEEEKEIELNISVPQMRKENLLPETPQIEPESQDYIAEFTTAGKQQTVELKFTPGKRIGIGRTKENDLTIEDASVSKIHAAFVLSAENQLMVADTGSTNGTFINGQRIAYGRAFPVGENDKVKFGNIEVFMRAVPKQTNFETSESYQFETANTQNIVASQNCATNQTEHSVQDLATNQDYSTQKKSTGIYATNENQNAVSNPILSNTNTIAANQTIGEIPVPQPNLTNQNLTINPVNIQPKVEKMVPQVDEKIDNNKQSEVFSTEPRIKFNFDEEQK
jgi:pSer/pThr/pTyr-binding forkhead associated (FHA) protein